MRPAEVDGNPGYSSKANKPKTPKPTTYAKFLSVDVSSPLGQYIYSLSTSQEEIDISSLCVAERKAALRSVAVPNQIVRQRVSADGLAPLIVEGGHGDEFPVSYRGQRTSRHSKKQDPHKYCFTSREKAVRLFALENGKIRTSLFCPLANTDLVILPLAGLTPESMKVYKQLCQTSLRSGWPTVKSGGARSRPKRRLQG